MWGSGKLVLNLIYLLAYYTKANTVSILKQATWLTILKHFKHSLSLTGKKMRIIIIFLDYGEDFKR